MNRLKLTASAADDLKMIEAQTASLFGDRQAMRLLDEIEKSLLSLVAFPDSGHARPELDPPGLTFRYMAVMRRFMLVYHVTDQEIVMVRIVDGTRDFSALWDDQAAQGK